jgi:hypothetical protein
VDTLSNRINGAQAQSDDARAFFRGELKTLDPTYQAAASRTTTELTDYFDVSIEPESCWVDYAVTPRRK